MTREEQLACLTDRPCEGCKFHSENGCGKWNCVFEQEPSDADPCEDAVSREAALKAIEGKEYKFQVYEAIENLPPVTPKQRWIPVSERLPKEHTCDDGFIEPSKSVLVQMKSGCMKVSRYWGSRKGYKDCPWIDLSYPTTDEVIYWQPLPEKYKEGESE